MSAAFVEWSGEGREEKGVFLQNVLGMNYEWEKGNAKLESIPIFSMKAEREDCFMSFDVEAGYHHVCLHPDMLDFFYSITGEDISDV